MYFIYIYIWFHKPTLSLLPLPHSCIPSGSPRSRFFCRFQLVLPRTFSLFFSPSTKFFAYPFSLFGRIWRRGGWLWGSFFNPTNEGSQRKSKFRFSHASLDKVSRREEFFFKKCCCINFTQYNKMNVNLILRIVGTSHKEILTHIWKGSRTRRWSPDSLRVPNGESSDISFAPPLCW